MAQILKLYLQIPLKQFDHQLIHMKAVHHLERIELLFSADNQFRKTVTLWHSYLSIVG